MSGGLVSPHSPEMLRVRLGRACVKGRLSVCEILEHARGGAGETFIGNLPRN